MTAYDIHEAIEALHDTMQEVAEEMGFAEDRTHLNPIWQLESDILDARWLRMVRARDRLADKLKRIPV